LVSVLPIFKNFLTFILFSKFLSIYLFKFLESGQVFFKERDHFIPKL